MRISILAFALTLTQTPFAQAESDAAKSKPNCSETGTASQLAGLGLDIACQASCKQFWIDHPETQPSADEHPYCHSGLEFLKSIPKTIGPRCWQGFKDGFSVTQHLKAYALFVKDIGGALQKAMAEQKEFFAKAKEDPEFRLGLVRMLSQYSLRSPDGSYQIKDEELPTNLVNGDVGMLALMLQKDLSSRERSCSIQIAQLTKSWENSGLDGNALATKRYQTIASRAPECIGTLGLQIPSDNSAAPDPATSNLQCLSAEKIEQSICTQAANFASDPMTFVPIGMVAFKSFRLVKSLPGAAARTSNLLRPTVEGFDKFKTANSVAKIMVTPYKPLAENAAKTVRVVGSNFSSKETAATFVTKLDEFNKSAQAMGFKTPQSTRVILADQKLLPSLGGPYAMSSKIGNIRDLRLPDNTIVMKPIHGYQKAVIKSPTAVIHEQAHTVFSMNYKASAYVNQDHTVQEALVDFMAAHKENSPLIGENARKNALALRDIARGRDYHNGGSSDLITPENFDAASHHTNSIPFSNLLWQVRNVVGEQKMSSLIKPIVDDLNRNYASAGLSTQATGVAYEKANFQYFAASVRKTLVDNGVDVQGFKSLSITQNDTNNLFYLNQRDTVALSGRLTPAGDFAASASDPQESTLLIHATAAGTAAVEGGILYGVGKYATPNSGR